MVVGTCGICTADRGLTANVGASRRRSDAGMTKQEICDAIASKLGIPKHKLATGGTEPSAFWHAVCDAVGVSKGGTKPDMARRVVESLGGRWPVGADSTDTRSGGGDTVTGAGLMAVLAAVSRTA
jgi:hypothetical protein